MRRGYDVSGAGTSSSHPHALPLLRAEVRWQDRSTSSTRAASGLGTRFPGRRSTTVAGSGPTGRALWNSETHHRRQSAAPERPATRRVLLNPPRPPAFRSLRRVVVHRHLGVLDEARQAGPVVAQALQDLPRRRVQVRRCQLRLAACPEGRHRRTQCAVGRRESGRVMADLETLIIESVQFADPSTQPIAQASDPANSAPSPESRGRTPAPSRTPARSTRF